MKIRQNRPQRGRRAETWQGHNMSDSAGGNQAIHSRRKGNWRRECPRYPTVYQRGILDSARRNALAGLAGNLWKPGDGPHKRGSVQDTLGRGCLWYAGAILYHLRYRGGLHNCSAADGGVPGEISLYLLADQGYNIDAILHKAAEGGRMPVILLRNNRKHRRESDRYLYKPRYLRECFLLFRRCCFFRCCPNSLHCHLDFYLLTTLSRLLSRNRERDNECRQSECAADCRNSGIL